MNYQNLKIKNSNLLITIERGVKIIMLEYD